MHVTDTTPDRLVIEDRPWFLWIMLPVLGGTALLSALAGRIDGTAATLLVGALGVGSFWLLHHFAPFQRFTFDRAAGAFTHDLHRVTGQRRWSRPLADIERAAPQAHWSDGARLERVALIMKDGKYPLESGFSSRSAKPVIDAINSWLAP